MRGTQKSEEGKIEDLRSRLHDGLRIFVRRVYSVFNWESVYPTGSEVLVDWLIES